MIEQEGFIMDSSKLPQKYDHISVEKKWMKFWDEKNIFAYDKNISRKDTFVIDTPPPTVSGSLHVGHFFSYSHTDAIARFNRMIGKNIFYPMGWDDNGLPTERRVQNLLGITCDPTLPYDPNLKFEDFMELDQEKSKAKDKDKEKKLKPVSRKNFLECCTKQTLKDEVVYESLWKNLALSIDWKQTYSTVGEHCAHVSQLSFLDLVEKGFVYSSDAPNMWDTTFQTAVAQAEIEDREQQGFFYDIRFSIEGGGDFVISTTRPELLASCVAVVAHPDDNRFKNLFGKYAITPLFGAKVPIMPAEHADPEKGTGILMVCTFGDIHDVNFWKKEKLPLRQIIGRSGKLISIDFNSSPFSSTNAVSANEKYSQIAGLYVKQARKKVVEMLKEYGGLVGDPRTTTQAVKFYEKGDQPLEFVPTRQWFVKILEHKNSLLEFGAKVNWRPATMLNRYNQWVEGLNQDWCISRQRFFGIPFPVWYPVNAEGEVNYSCPIFADKNTLPLDPQMSTPKGFTESQRGKPNGFIGDPDVMDTWATSSVTPQINSHWSIDTNKHAKLFPADLRPQAHEIIRTWAFYTITKAWMHEKTIPWHNIAISGWVVNPNREKMSKSKGNAVTPESMMEKYSADAIRYWALRARLGHDTIYDELVFKIGQKLTTKLFNASKFVLMQVNGEKTRLSDITCQIDLAWIARMKKVVEESYEDFSKFDFASVLTKTESLFWDFCDNYVELVKVRAYKQKDNALGRSAIATLGYSLKTFLRLFAPFLPYMTEEVWSWAYADISQSVHKTSWPLVSELTAIEVKLTNVNDLSLQLPIEAMNKIRTQKTLKQTSLRTPVNSIVFELAKDNLVYLKETINDVIDAGNIIDGAITYKEIAKLEGQELLKAEVVLGENA